MQKKLSKCATTGTSKFTAIAMAGLLGLGLASADIVYNSGPAVAQRTLAPSTFADLVEKVRPAVVSINVKNGSKTSEDKKKKPPFQFKGIPELPEGHPFNEFFKRFGAPRGGQQGPRNLPSLAQGSGFIVSSDGYVVTNNHVVDKAGEITVTLDNGDKLDAKLIGGDARTDIALLKITEKRTFPTVKFSNKPARVGDWVLAVGNPFGLGGTVTAGIVSAKNRDIGSGPYDYLQIDAAVNRGNSGGPTFNLQGEVVGVNTAIFSPSGGNVGIAFAIPAALTEDVIAQLKSSGSVSRGWLGVTIQNVTEDLANSLGLEKKQGALVTKISRGGPASKSDIKVGDAIVQVNEEDIKDSRDLARKIASISPKATARVKVYRDGQEKVINVKLGRFPGLKKLAKLQAGKEIGEDFDDLGLSLAPASTKPGSGKKGVVITEVDPSSEAAGKGLKQGDIILKVGRINVNDPDDVYQSIEDAKKAGLPTILLYIKAGDNRRFIALPLKKS